MSKVTQLYNSISPKKVCSGITNQQQILEPRNVADNSCMMMNAHKESECQDQASQSDVGNHEFQTPSPDKKRAQKLKWK